MRKLAIVLVAASLAFTAQANVVGYENFDGGAINLSATENVGDYDAVLHVGDVFGRVGPSYLGDVGMPYDVADDTVMSMSGGTAPLRDRCHRNRRAVHHRVLRPERHGRWGPAGLHLRPVVVRHHQRDHRSTTSRSTSPPWVTSKPPSTDGFKIEAQIDGGGFQEIFLGRTNEDLFKTYRPDGQREYLRRR